MASKYQHREKKMSKMTLEYTKFVPMKNILIILLLFGTTFLKAQDYTAIHVIGKIYMPDKKAYLQRGDKISENDKLQFQSADAKAAMLSTSKGRYVIQKDAAVSTSDNSLSYALKSIIMPVKGQMSTRSGGINNSMDFQKQLGSETIAWIGDQYSVNVSPSSYPTNDSKFFYVSYSYKGESINKMIAPGQDQLVFIKNDLYSVDDNTIEPAEAKEMVLYYYDAESEEATFVSPLKFRVVTAQELKSLESSIPISIIGDEKLQMLHDFITSLYGKCDISQISEVLSN
jgi:hypothetical protein